MQCMKCGRDLEESSVFCEECLADMAQYPVKPGTVVQLPKYHEQPQRKLPQRRRQTVPLEEQVKLLRRWARALAVALVLCLMVLIGAGYLAAKQYIKLDNQLLPGQNYSSATSSQEPERNR